MLFSYYSLISTILPCEITIIKLKKYRNGSVKTSHFFNCYKTKIIKELNFKIASCFDFRNY